MVLELLCWSCDIGIVLLELWCWNCGLGVVALELWCWSCSVGIVVWELCFGVVVLELWWVGVCSCPKRSRETKHKHGLPVEVASDKSISKHIRLLISVLSLPRPINRGPVRLGLGGRVGVVCPPPQAVSRNKTHKILVVLLKPS